MYLVVRAIFLLIIKKEEIWSKEQEGIFLGYSINNMVYQVFIKRIKSTMEQSEVITDKDEDYGLMEKMTRNIFQTMLRANCSLLKEIQIQIMMRIMLLKENKHHQG